jgi:hypothetical protein
MSEKELVKEEVRTTEAKPTLIEEANSSAERVEKANEEARLLIEEAAKIRLGGRSKMIEAEKPKTPEEIIKEDCLKMLSGTGLNPFK